MQQLSCLTPVVAGCSKVHVRGSAKAMNSPRPLMSLWRSPTLIGASAAPVAYERLGTAGADRLIDLADHSTDFEGGAGCHQLCFLQAPGAARPRKDLVWDFNPHVDASSGADTVEVSKALSSSKGCSNFERAIADVGADAVLRFADGSTVTFEGLPKAQLDTTTFCWSRRSARAGWLDLATLQTITKSSALIVSPLLAKKMGGLLGGLLPYAS
jgi:hypothetical protein